MTAGTEQTYLFSTSTTLEQGAMGIGRVSLVDDHKVHSVRFKSIQFIILCIVIRYLVTNTHEEIDGYRARARARARDSLSVHCSPRGDVAISSLVGKL